MIISSSDKLELGKSYKGCNDAKGDWCDNINFVPIRETNWEEFNEFCKVVCPVGYYAIPDIFYYEVLTD